MVNLFDRADGILTMASQSVQNGMFQASSHIYHNGFFVAAFTLGVTIFAFMFAFKRFSNEEAVYKAIWTIFVFSFVYAMLYNSNSYQMMTDLFRVPSEIFLTAVDRSLSMIGLNASMKEILNLIVGSNVRLLDSIRDQGAWDNLYPYFVSLPVWLVGTFLIVTIIFMVLVSTFLAEIVLSLAPLILPCLIFAKTQGVAFQWLRLYISLSLYAPFTLLFGVMLVEVNTLIQDAVMSMANKGFAKSMEVIVVNMVVQIIVVLAIYRIPNIINQIIGSSNEGSSLSGSVGTASAGVTALMGAARFGGLNLAAKGVSAATGAVTNRFGGGGGSTRPRVTVEPH